MTRILISTSFLLLILCSIFTTTATANDVNSPWEKYSLSLGGFLANIDTTARLGVGGGNTGIEFDLEDATGLETSSTVFRADGLMRLGEERKHRLDFSYFFYDRKATKILQRDIDFGTLPTLSVGATVTTEFNIQIYKLNYSYSLIRDNRFDISAGLGVYVMPIKMAISTAAGQAESKSFTAPLPAISLRMDFAITPKLFLRQSAELFYLTYNQFKGGMLDLTVGLEYKVHEKIGLGLAVDSFHLGLEADGEDYPAIDLTGAVKFSYTGVMLFAKYYF